MAIDAFYDVEGKDKFRSALDTALTVVFQSKQKLGHLTIYHPIYRKVAAMDLMLQNFLSDNFPSEKAEADSERVLEFYVAKYGGNGIDEMVII